MFPLADPTHRERIYRILKKLRENSQETAQNTENRILLM
jgi:hypothetical protein